MLGDRVRLGDDDVELVGDRQQPEYSEEQDLQQDGEHERRHGDPADGEHAGAVVYPTALLVRRERAQAHPDHDGQEQRQKDELQGVGKEAEDVAEHRPPGAQRRAPVALDQIADVDAVLDVQRTVETEDAAGLLDLLRPGARPGVDRGRVRGDHPHEQERDDRDPEQDEGHERDAAQKIGADAQLSASRSDAPRNGGIR